MLDRYIIRPESSASPDHINPSGTAPGTEGRRFPQERTTVSSVPELKLTTRFSSEFRGTPYHSNPSTQDGFKSFAYSSSSTYFSTPLITSISKLSPKLGKCDTDTPP